MKYQIIDASAKRTTLVTATLGIVLALAMCATFSASATAATSGPFCPGNSGTISLGPNPARCVWVFHTSIAFVDFTNVLTSVNKCAVVKPNADGSGGNVGGQVDCQPGTTIATVFFPPNGASGHATGINNSGNFHTGFKGVLTLY